MDTSGFYKIDIGSDIIICAPHFVLGGYDIYQLYREQKSGNMFFFVLGAMIMGLSGLCGGSMLLLSLASFFSTHDFAWILSVPFGILIFVGPVFGFGYFFFSKRFLIYILFC